MSFNRKKDLCTWVAIHEKASGMAGPCTCIVGFGIENEKNSIKKSLALLKKKNLHPRFKTTESGMVFSIEQPGLAASPDGFFL
ncbi:hypothetical protein OUZ56_012674 [Daphnia magna]|uniref:Uncharacterized protein n=1 Tax=Daphnia magna TaxID=35525 RepID=A0ABQ9Z3L7_9CRUS|nr:hypothetical protein OUZ56_012639 [Daphnia magna]KAK4007517.1 hypothetical protein OUZ56_012674 [Daphnia magna]